MTLVRDLMTPDVVTVESGTRVVDAAKKMIEEEKGPLPIVAGGRVLGVVTDRDVIAHVVATGRDVETTSVDDVASRNVVTVAPEQDVAEARRLMAQNHVDRVLVMEGGRLVGIISEADIRSDEGSLADPLSATRMGAPERRSFTRRSTDRQRRTGTSWVLFGSGLILRLLGVKKGVELWQSVRHPAPPPRRLRLRGPAGAALATLGVTGGAAYLFSGGRQQELVGRVRRQRTPEGNTAPTLQPEAPVAQSSTVEPVADPVRPVPPRPSTGAGWRTCDCGSRAAA